MKEFSYVTKDAIKEFLITLPNFPKRAYSVMEIRTGFATGLPVLSGGLFGAYFTGNIQWFPLLLFFIAGFCFNIAANTANEIHAFLAHEEDEHTFTGHTGSEGLVRGKATLLDAFFVLLSVIGVGSTAGLVLVWQTQNSWLFVWGVLGLIAALTYSLGPVPYLLLPVSEVISGFFVGGLSCYLSASLQAGGGNWWLFCYSVISTVMTVFLMSTNNSGDYAKDWGKRTTLPHVIGFREAILLIIPEAGLMVSAWLCLSVILPNWLIVVGCVIFLIQGYWRWYRTYYHIQSVYPEMGKEYGPRPLLLIYHFHGWMSLCFLLLVRGAIK